MSSKIERHLRVIPKPSTNLDLAIDMFITAKEAERCTPRTIRTYRWTLEKFVAWLREHDVADVESITPTHIRLYLSEADKGGAKASYTYTHAKIIKTWTRFLSNEDLLPNNPMAKVAMPRLDKEILPAFSPDDVRKLLDACDNLRDKALLLFMLDTGVRAAELVALTVGDVQLKTGAVNVKQGKGRKDRIAFAGAKSLRALHKYMASRPDAKPDEPLFPSFKGGSRLTTSGLLLLCRRLGRVAGVENCHPHTFRRSFALWSLRSGMDIFSLQKLLGHADLSVLRKYLDQVKEHLQEAHKRHGAVDSML